MALGWLTENGWPSCAYEDCDLSKVPGTSISIPVQIGIPNTILKAFIADLNAFVEPYNGQNDWGGWTPTNSVATSNHLGGTAVDFNWDDHPMGPEAENPDAGWQGSSLINGDEVPSVRALLIWYEGLVFWGGDWDTPKDTMHFQMGYDTYDNIAKCMDFIGRKIRKDMFSTYTRGGTSQNGTVTAPAGAPAPTPAPTPVPTPASAATDPINVLAAATGMTVAHATQVFPAIQQGLIGSQCTNVNRIAMWLAEEGEESASFTATVEIGNLDGTTYQGRTWEQITGLSNYAAFSKWAHANNIPGVTSDDYFVQNPAALGDPQYESIGATWYWTVARPQINGLADAGDVVGVTKAINGGLNGIDDRTRRWNLALAQGYKLLTLIKTADAAPDSGGTITLTAPLDKFNKLCDDAAWIREQMDVSQPGWDSDADLGQDSQGRPNNERTAIAQIHRAVVPGAKIDPTAPKVANP